MKSGKNVILLSGRPGSGKTEMMIAYANIYPNSTLVISEESSNKELLKRNLSKEIQVIGEDDFQNINLLEYTTICIDYYELFNRDLINTIIQDIIKLDIRLVLLTQLNRNYDIRDNPFKRLFRSK